jgi:TPR repeat protein/signal transduction histidine kinase
MTEQNTFAFDELQQKANEGDVQAQFDLALCYLNGTGIEKNEELAFNWHKKAAEQGHVNAQFALGLSYLLGNPKQQQNNNLIFKWVNGKFVDKNIDPAFDLGVSQALSGKLTSVNDHLAFVWLRKATEQNHAEANYWLGICYRDGIGTHQNDELAFNCFKQASEQGCLDAYYSLALCYRDGKGVKQSDNITFDLLTTAVENGGVEPDAYLSLGELYADGKGVVQSDELAFHWYEKAAEKHNAEAHYRLGNFYYEGRGVEKNNDIAFQHYEIASDIGHVLAKSKQGHMFFCTGAIIIFLGQTEYSIEEAFEFFTKAIEYGHLETFKELAECYCSYDFNDSYSLAINWYEEAYKKGHTEACEWLAKICQSYFSNYFMGIGVEKDDELAFELILKAAECDSIEAHFLASSFILTHNKKNEKSSKWCFEGFTFVAEQNDNIELKLQATSYIGFCYENGIGVEKNPELAQHYYGQGMDITQFSERFFEKTPGDSLILLPPKSQLAKEKLAEILGNHFKKNDLDSANNFIEQAFEGAKGIEIGFKKVGLMVVEQAQELNKINQELEEKNKQLQASQIELEDMMSMFAHKFRSPLDAIIYNTTHENQVKLYTEAAQTMRGLLNIFSIISTDAEILKEKVKQDHQGSGRLATVFSKTLDMILLHLLPVSGAEKIQQHYLSYAKTHAQCAALVSYKTWCEEYFELEQVLQSAWEASYAQLLSQSATLEQRLAWLEEHFFKLELIGFERADIQFKEYGVTESLLTILLNEILVNAFKYYSSASKQPVILEWIEREGYQVLLCRNPSIRSERTIIKGSHKGHVFLSTLARKTGSLFNKPIPQDNFIVEFGIPNELLISK